MGSLAVETSEAMIALPAVLMNQSCANKPDGEPADARWVRRRAVVGAIPTRARMIPTGDQAEHGKGRAID